MTDTSKFWDRIAERYAKQPIADQESYQKKVQITREYLSHEIEALEFGCGTGSTALLHAPYVKHILAIDISAKMIEIAQSKATAADVTNITFRQAAIEDLVTLDHSYDVVMGFSILHLLADKDAVIARVHKMLKPGGVFITSTACLGDTMKFMAIILPVGRFLGLIPMVRVFTSKELEDSLARAGLPVESHWQPAKGKAVFLIARKAVQA